MDKHTKIIIVSFVTMLLASLTAFSILYLLPLVTSGTDPPQQKEEFFVFERLMLR